MKERFSLTIHWLVTVILMIGLYLYPTVATVIYVQGSASNQEIIEVLLIAYAAITGIFFLCWWIKWMLTGSTQIWPLKKTYDFWFGWVGFPIICWAFLILIITVTPEG